MFKDKDIKPGMVFKVKNGRKDEYIIFIKRNKKYTSNIYKFYTFKTNFSFHWNLSTINHYLEEI